MSAAPAAAVKPRYRVPSMAEVRATPWNGFTVASSFSGCGGSSLGYRMAGFRVGWASEFIPAAQDTYRANAAPYTVLDTRDIREVAAADILAALRLQVGELDLWDGSPPCASFSSSGKGAAGWGEVKQYSDTKQRTDDLFFEYTRLLRDLQPRTFVAENVPGLLRGAAKGYFKIILGELRAAGYRVEARVLDASRLDVPQARRRLIFVGVREDLGLPPAYPTPLPHRYTIADALPWIRSHDDDAAPSPACDEAEDWCALDPETGHNVHIGRYAIAAEWHRLRPGQNSDRYLNLTRPDVTQPCPTITQAGGHVGSASVTHWSEPRKLTLRELRALSSFPHDFTLTGTYSQRWERIGRAVPPVMMSHIAAAVRDQVLTPLRASGRI